MSRTPLIRVSSDANETTVAFSPEDFNRSDTARQITRQLLDLLAGETEQDPGNLRLNLDFKGVGWISSAGLNELIGINSHARSQGVRVVLVDVPKTVRDVFALTRLERIFEFDSSSITA